MIYPPLLKNNSLIGITAPSSGVDITKETLFDCYKDNLKLLGFRSAETANVRTGLTPSSDAITRAKEFNELIYNTDVDMILCAKGGDLLFEILDYVDFYALRENPKWVQGYSDPTSLLYAITTKHDIATLYGNGGSAFSMTPMHKSLIDSMSLLKGDIDTQYSFDLYEKNKGDSQFGYKLDTPVSWDIITGEKSVTISGRFIGGCVDVLTDIIATPYDGTKEFINKYQADGIIWYFDNFALSSERLYNFLWHLKKCGYFQAATGCIFGRNLFESSFVGLDYSTAILKALGDLNIPIITNADIGHVSPRIAIINGALAHVKIENKKGTVQQFLL